MCTLYTRFLPVQPRHRVRAGMVNAELEGIRPFSKQHLIGILVNSRLPWSCGLSACPLPKGPGREAGRQLPRYEPADFRAKPPCKLFSKSLSGFVIVHGQEYPLNSSECWMTTLAQTLSLTLSPSVIMQVPIFIYIQNTRGAATSNRLSSHHHLPQLQLHSACHAAAAGAQDSWRTSVSLITSYQDPA